MFPRIHQRLHSRSAALLLTLERGLPRIGAIWLILIIGASALRLATSPFDGLPAWSSILSFALLALAPIASALLALGWFDEARDARRVPRAIRRHPLYGPGGMMVSLLVGLLINIPLRAGEYLVAMPALGGSVPPWLATLHFALTLDVVLFTSLYMIAFVAALKRSVIFPPLLMLIWLADVAMQIGIGQAVAVAGGLPPAVDIALQRLLDGNLLKVLISAALWVPYLLLSSRVAITYRHQLEVAR